MKNLFTALAVAVIGATVVAKPWKADHFDAFFNDNANNPVSFHTMGKMFPESGWIHLRLNIPISGYMESCVELQTVITDELEKTTSFSIIHNQTRSQLRNLFDVCTKIERLQGDLTKPRQKRSLLLAAGGVIAGLFSLFSVTEIFNLESKYQQIANNQKVFQEILNIENEHLKILENNFNVLKQTTLITAKQVVKLSKFSHHLFHLQRLNTQTDDLHEISNMLDATFQSLYAAKFPVGLLKASQMKKILQKAVNMSNKYGLKIPLTNFHDLYQLPCSFIYGKDLIIFVHVPLFKEHNEMNLMKYAPAPIHLDNKKVFLQIEQDQTVLAFNKQNTLALEMTLESLQDCKRFGTTYLCPNIAIYQNSPLNTCLGALYFENSNKVTEQCKFSIIQNFESVTKLRQNEFLISISKEQQATITCDNTSYQGLIARSSILNLPFPCSLEFGNHFIQSQLQVDETLTLKPKVISFGVKQLYNTSTEKLLMAIDTLNKTTKIVSSEQVKRKLQEMQISDANLTQNWLIGSCVVGGVLFIAFAVFVSFKLREKCCNSRWHHLKESKVHYKKRHTEACSHNKIEETDAENGEQIIKEQKE